MLLLSFLVASGCSARRRGPALPDTGLPLSSGDHVIPLRHAGRDRSYVVHMPPRAVAGLPLLLAFHGGGGHATQFKESAGLDRVADAEGFVVAYPNGTGPLPRRLLTWNAGDNCCGYAHSNDVDDVGFAAAVVEDLAQRARIDRSRVYATGHSNGAILSHRIAAERPSLVAAVAPVAGSLDLAGFAPAVAVAVMQIHSVDDPRALYAGGLGPPFPGTNNRVQHQGVQQGIDRWIAANGCASSPDTVEVRRGSGGNPPVPQQAVHLVWRGCRHGGVVSHWRLSGSGHGWPGDPQPAGGESLVGPQTSLLDAADEVWRFVSQFRR